MTCVVFRSCYSHTKIAFGCVRNETNGTNLVSKENQNYNATHTSNNVTVNKRDFQDSIDRMARAKLYQEWIVENLPSKVIQFDDLVHGTADVGYKYQVDTTDEHSNIENYITNVDEVKSWYNHAKLLAC